MIGRTVRNVMPVRVTCKFDEDKFDNEVAIVFTTCVPLYVYGDIFVTQGQLTSKRLVLSGPKSNPSENLCLSLKIRSKKKALLHSQHLSSFKSMGALVAMETTLYRPR